MTARKAPLPPVPQLTDHRFRYNGSTAPVLVFDPFRSPYRNFSCMTSPVLRAAWKPVVLNGALISNTVRRELSPFSPSPVSEMCAENIPGARNSM
ncbi:hypothetical protein KOW79_018014 [Hemibagrus wyckioides]|uniref:Uncharacterized protein n=1 Tax=Hemibagrus wyckioides TaxID=337641 RepID=A0A9D3SGM2_9TELE|nr:hypothetical protein KOW79_018014 [Hemibagrus wyckioides]